MNEKEIQPEINNEIIEENTEEQLFEALTELKKHKKKEKYLLTAVFAGALATMGFAYTVWQNNTNITTMDYYYYGGTPTAYDTSVGTVGGGGGCGSGSGASGGSCCGGTSTGEAVNLQEVESLARLFYKQNFGDDTGLEFKVADYGCHIQIDVYGNGKLVRSLVYNGGQISEY